MQSNNAAVSAVHEKFHGPWEGKDKIVVGIDIGTTYSGVVFAHLVEGNSKSLQRVVSWPGQEAKNQQAKIPTVVLYNAKKKAVSFGAEALGPEAGDDSDECQLVEHFKLHLHPPELRAKHGLVVEPLPDYAPPLSQIYADFLRYLLQHTQKYFYDRVLDGANIWKTYKPTMDVIIAHPNGWGIKEQSFLRTAAVNAGLAKDEDEALDRIHFVTEAEASVHFCTYHTTLGSQMKPGDNFAVCDAGGSTVDTTVYTVKQTHPSIQLAERCDSACVQAGAIFINKSTKNYLEQEFRKAGISPDDTEEFISRGIKDFEESAKRAFRGSSTNHSIEIAGTKFSNLAIEVRRGRMRLLGSTVESFFDGCVKEIISSVNSQLASAAAPVSYIILVGGFGESPYLHEKLKARFSSRSQIITTTNEPTSKAVADGAVIWHCVKGVVSRAPRYSFGIEVVVPLIHNSKEHRGRPIVSRPSGPHVAGGWSQIVTKGVAIDCDHVSRRTYRREYWVPDPELSAVNQDICRYAFGGGPKWMRNKAGNITSGFQKVCTVTADISNLRNALRSEMGPNGAPYWSLSFSVCIRFGRTELQAFLEWVENGVTHTGRARIIPSSELVQ